MNRRIPTLCLSLLVGLPLAASLPGGSVIVAILGISFLIFVHEWGHFYACKLTGTRTETFSIGFGPRLFGWEKTREGQRRFTIGRRQTDPADHTMDFRIAAVPLGGYVKMAGELPGEGGGADGEPAPDEFPAKSASARIFIVCAGVIMNFFTAFVFYTLCIQLETPFDPPLVGLVEQGSAAWHAGVKTGDRIESIDGTTTPTFIDLRVGVAMASSDDDSQIGLTRDGKEETFPFRPVYDEELGLLRFGVARGMGLALGEGDEAFEIGPIEAATINGIRVRGGAEAYAVLRMARSGGFLPIVATKADGTTITLEPQPAEEADEAPGAKVGIAAFTEATVQAVRGAAAKVLEKGDVLVTAHAGGQLRPLDTGFSLEALPFRAPITNFVVMRAGKPVEIAVDLPDAAAIAAFLDEVALDPKVDAARAAPIDPGAMVETANELWRYPSTPARDVGLPSGAKILKVKGLVVGSITEVAKELRDAKPGVAIPFTIQVGDGPERTIEITPVALERVGTLKVTRVEYKETWQPDGFGQAVVWGWDRMVRETMTVFRTIKSLVTGQLSFSKNIAGPVTLIDVSRKSAEDGSLRLIWFLAYVSVMLAVLNILPIPVLDGGHLMFILIEKARGKPLKDETIYRMQQVGFLLLLLLMFFAFKNDFTRLFPDVF
ncbi:MAG: site-2 protease family protein [Planctomycetota bacterium]|nr:site-2 protease family protein [Planctomycetota bacterium]